MLSSAAAAPAALAQVRDLADAVHKAGRQRMLSQRMVKAWLALGQQVEPVRAELTLARQQWLFFDSALSRASRPDGRDAADVFVSSENILQVMDRITGLYARLGA